MSNLAASPELKKMLRFHKLFECYKTTVPLLFVRVVDIAELFPTLLAAITATWYSAQAYNLEYGAY